MSHSLAHNLPSIGIPLRRRVSASRPPRSPGNNNPHDPPAAARDLICTASAAMSRRNSASGRKVSILMAITVAFWACRREPVGCASMVRTGVPAIMPVRHSNMNERPDPFGPPKRQHGRGLAGGRVPAFPPHRAPSLPGSACRLPAKSRRRPAATILEAISRSKRSVVGARNCDRERGGRHARGASGRDTHERWPADEYDGRAVAFRHHSA